MDDHEEDLFFMLFLLLLAFSVICSFFHSIFPCILLVLSILSKEGTLLLSHVVLSMKTLRCPRDTNEGKEDAS